MSDASDRHDFAPRDDRGNYLCRRCLQRFRNRCRPGPRGCSPPEAPSPEAPEPGSPGDVAFLRRRVMDLEERLDYLRLIPVSRRNARITYEALMGTSHGALAEQYGLSDTRIGQIKAATLRRIAVRLNHLHRFRDDTGTTNAPEHVG